MYKIQKVGLNAKFFRNLSGLDRLTSKKGKKTSNSRNFFHMLTEIYINIPLRYLHQIKLH